MKETFTNCDFAILFSSTMTNRQGQLFKGGKEKGDILMEDRASLGDITSSSKLHQDRSTRYHRFSSNANTNIRTNTTNNNNSRSTSSATTDTKSLLKLQMFQIWSTNLPMLCHTDQLVKRQYTSSVPSFPGQSGGACDVCCLQVVREVTVDKCLWAAT